MSLAGRVSQAVAVALSLCAAAGAQVNGPEFSVNTYTTGAQYAARVAADGAGRFVVAWAGSGAGDASGIFARRYRSSGAPIGDEFLVNSALGSSEGYPAVDAAADAGFVVAWEATGDGYGYGIFARRFDANGAPIGGDFQVNNSTVGNQQYADVAVASDGSFVVVWNDIGYDFNYTIRAREYDSSGSPVGLDFQVNTFGTAFNYHPKVTTVAGGGFVVVWDGEGLFDDAGIFGRRYDAAGSPIGGEFRVNGNLLNWDAYPSIAAEASGAFVVSWQGADGATGDYDIFARRFDELGDPVAGQFRVNTYTTGEQYGASIGSDHLGNFLVAWNEVGPDGSGYSVQARRYDSNGSALTGDFRVNTYTINHQYYASVAVDPRENFFVVWESNGQDGSARGVFGQRFGDFIFGDGFR